MKKKLICVMLSASMLLSLTACSKADINTNPGQSEISTEENASAANEAVTTQADTSEVAESEKNYASGDPWINSNYLQNVIDNPEVDLKDDFNLAINREWVTNNPIKTGQASKVNLAAFEDELNSRLTSILEDKTYSGNHDADIAQALYNSFLDWDERASCSLDALMPYLDKIEAIESYDDMIKYCENGLDTLSDPFSYSIISNPQDSSSHCIGLSSIEYFFKDPADYENLDNMDDYTRLTYDCTKKKVATVLAYCGYSEDEINSIFDGAIEYEKLNAKYSYTRDEVNLTETITTLNKQIVTDNDIKNYNWYVPFKTYLKAMGLKDIPYYCLYEKMDYFENLDSVLNEDNIELFKDYLLAHSADYAIKLLDKDCYYIYLDTFNELNGITGYSEETKYALSFATSRLGWPLSKLYVEKYVTADDKEEIYNIISEIVAEYKTMLESEEFLSESTKREAIYKLDNIRIKCMYPDNWDDYDYSGLELSNNFFENAISIKIFDNQKKIDTFYDPIDLDKWNCTPITLNAFYDANDNSINILPGLIGDVLYNKDMPVEEVYARVGTVIGHEISHAFDPEGATFDADGNSKNWWTDEDYESFNELTHKLVLYYDNIKIWDDFYANGELVKDEACADMAGVGVILQLAKNEENFDYDLFFRSYADLWASNCTPEYMYYCGTYDSHPIDYLRVNITVAQFEEFYETYGIKEGDGMYIAPEDRVKIW